MSDAPQIGPYTLQRLLGGGMADVYLAWDNNNRWPVALKLMRAATGQDARMLKRFEREAATLMKLRHPHIIQVYDAGQTADGRPYIAMEYVTGGDLVELMHARRGKLTTTESLYLMRRVAGAMAYAHERGIVHRDLKPSNILLRADTGEPVIADLGIAALAGAKPLTGTMEALGTPQYMAPEQGSQHGAADGRADVYAIGVMLFELLIGRLPFEGDNGWALLLQKQQEDAPPVLSRRRDLDPRLAAVVDTCLRRDPAARYPTAGALATALDAFLPATDEALAAALLAPAATSTTAPTSAPPTDTPQPVPTTATNLPVAEIIAPIDGATLVAGGPVALVIAASDAAGLAGVTIEVNGRTLADYTLDGEPLFTRTINWDAPPTAGDVVFTVWAVNIHDVPSQPVSVAVTLGVEETPTRTATPTRAATTETSGGRTATATRPAGTATQSATAPPAGPAGPTTLLGFEAFGGWVRGVPNGTLTQSSEQTHGGSFAAKLEYNFPGAGNDFVDFTQEHDIEGAPKALQLWVYGDESDHYLNVWIRDDEGERWSVDLGRIQHTGWQRMTGRIDAEAPWPGGHVDGPDNGRIDYPILFSAIVLDDRPDDYVGQGTIYLDDLVATTLDE